MKLVPLMTPNATIGEAVEVCDGGTGRRVVANVTGGSFHGDRLQGTVRASGADWVVIDSTGSHQSCLRHRRHHGIR